LIDQEVELLSPQRVSRAGHHGTAGRKPPPSLRSESFVTSSADDAEDGGSHEPEALLLAAGDDSEWIGAAVQVGADQVLGREQLQLTAHRRTR